MKLKPNIKNINSEFIAQVVPQLNSLKYYALRMTRNSDDSEDLLQDTLLSAFRFFNKYAKGTNIKAWLLKIMKNTFINNYRKRIKQPQHINYEDVLSFYETVKPEEVLIGKPQSDAFADSLDDKVFNALSVLPDNFRTIVFLSDIEGYSYKEISEFVDCPVGTVRSRLHRARKILYASLFKYARNNAYLS